MACFSAADRDAYRLMAEHAYADRDRLAAELVDLRRRLSVWAADVRTLAGAEQMADDMDAAAEVFHDLDDETDDLR